MTREELDRITYDVIGAAIEVHKELGPGLLESVYHKCMKRELLMRKIDFVSELRLDIRYKGMNVESDLRCDLLIEDSLVVELKAMEGILPIHDAQVLTYMKMLGKPKGLLINFNCTNIFKEGQKTYVNEIYRNLGKIPM